MVPMTSEGSSVATVNTHASQEKVGDAFLEHISTSNPEEAAQWGRTWAEVPEEYACSNKIHEFNVPLRHTVAESRKGALPSSCSFFWVDAEAVVLDTVKRAEDGDGLIVRLYEAHGGRVRARLVTGLPVATAAETDLLERETVGKPIDVKNGELNLAFGPFEVKTLRVK